MSDAVGRKVWEAEYEPFGKATVNQDPDGDGQIVINNLRFPGQYYDAETGLHYNYHRDYDPAIGRYLQPDPVGLEGGLNLYSYVTNNPVNFVDPLGLWEEGASWRTNMGNRLNVMWRALRYGELNALGKEFEGQFHQIAEMDPVDFTLSFSPGAPWKLGACKSATKWASQFAKRGWTEQQVSEALLTGQRFPAQNMVNPANSASRYIHPQTGKSVVIDDVTKELLHVGGPGFKY